MIRKLSILAGAALTGASLYAAPETFHAVKAAQPPVLDGKVEEAVWKSALCFDKFTVHDTDQAAYPVEARLLYDDEALYVAFVCPIPPGGKLKADSVKRDDLVYRDDCVEIMVDPNATGDRYFHFMVNPNGTIGDRYCDQGGHVGDEKWNSSIKAKAFKGKDFWSVEVKIPFSTLDINPGNAKVWGFNFCRDSRNPNQESSAAGGAFHNAGAFLKVDGIDLDLDRYGWGIGKPVVTGGRTPDGKLTATVKCNVSNQSDKAQEALIDVVLLGKNAAAAAAEKSTFSAKTSREEKRENLVLGEAGDYKCIVSVLDPVTRKVFKRTSFPVSVSFAPLEIAITQPSYRHTIYATQNLAEVVYTVNSPIASQLAGGTITTGIRDLDGKVLVEKNISAPGEVRFAAGNLPESKMQIYASAVGKDGTQYPEATAALRKVPAHRGEVRMDDDGFWVVDGKRFFMIGEWNDVHVEGVNVTVANPQVTERGEKFITGNFMWSQFPARKSYRNPNISAEDEEIIRAEARKFRDLPDFFAYYLVDEPEISGVSAVGIARVADMIRDEDPYHPIIVSNDTIAGIADYAPAGEINGLHPYPNPEPGNAKSNFNKFVTYMLQAEAFNRGRAVPQSIAYLQQGFNYGDHGAANSRIPSFDEIRTQYLGSLVLGGRGILLYDRNTNIYPELYIGIPNIVRELNWYAPALLENNLPAAEVSCDSDKVRFIAKKHDGEVLILAFQTDGGKVEANFKGPALNGKSLYVVGEERKVNAPDGSFKDSFENYQLHVYSTAEPPADIPALAATEAAIASANAERAKPGNLAFQMIEHEKMQISASSNAAYYRRPDCCLWHVTDGIIPDAKAYYAQQQRWQAANDGDKWIELAFDKPVLMGKVVIYPVDNSLKSFYIEAEENGKMVKVAEVKEGTAEAAITLNFAPRQSRRLKVVVTETNGKTAMISEIEVYEK